MRRVRRVRCCVGGRWARLRRLREHGMSVSAADRDAADRGGAAPVLETYDELGFNYRMTDVQAAIGLVQLGRLDAMVARRRDELLARLAAAGISARRRIMAVHLEPAYADTPHVPLPATERIARDSLIL